MCAIPFIRPALAQQPDSTLLSVARVFGTAEFQGEDFGPARWLASGGAYTTLEPSPGGHGQDIVRYDVRTGRRDVIVPARQLVPPGSSAPLAIQGYQWSPNGRMLLVYSNSRRVWRLNTRGDYWLFDLDGGALRRLGGDAAPSTLMFAKFSPDGGRVAYVRANNLYVEDAHDGHITGLTSDGSRTTINGTFDWVYEEELNLRDGFRWSPDGRRIAYWQLDARGVRDFDLIDDTDSLYSFVKPVQYPKAGTTNSAARVGVVDAVGGATRWLKVDGDPRNSYIARLEWAASPNEVVIQQLNRPQNMLRVLLGDARTGTTRTVLTERDSAWVDVVDDLRWVDNGRAFTWVSERDGWRHLYAVSRDGSRTRLVTPGAYDLHNPGSAFGAPLVIGMDSTAGWIYFTASPENPTQLYLYRGRLDGSAAAERVTPRNAPGTHSYDIAPGGHWAIHRYSRFGVPPIIDLVSLPDHKVVRTLVDNSPLRAKLASLRRGPMEFFRVPSEGVQLDGWVMRPPPAIPLLSGTADAVRRSPLLFYVYGEPAAQTVLDQWDDLYLWHLLLTQQGYVVASVDNRGTPAPKGRAWRKSIYKMIGVIATRDQANAARQAMSWPYVDSTRIGVWGWSGGGSMTLNLLFRAPEIYRMGMAVAPVSDLHYYDTIYQERYMGLPQENEEAYRRSSPITFAGQLRGDLLVVHGSGDDNVNFQNTEALVNALVAAGKPFTMMDYPNRSHCICEGPGTTLHLFGLLDRYLHERMPVSQAPAR